MNGHDRNRPVLHAETSPRCGSDQLRPRALPANLDRGSVQYLVCDRCGEEIGPASLPDPEAPSAIVIPLCRPAAKLPAIAGPFVSLFAPLRSALP